jgi:hypothetical protein
MARHVITIRNKADRERAFSLLAAAPFGIRFEIKSVRRTTEQNDRMWAMLTEVSRQLKWHGVTLRPDDWKLLFLDSLKRELRMMPNIDGTGFVNLGRSSSDLSIEEMSDLIELIFAFGAKHDVVFRDPEVSRSSLGRVPTKTETGRPAARQDPPPAAAGTYRKELVA